MREIFNALSKRAATVGNTSAIAAPGLMLTYGQLVSRVSESGAWARKLPNRVGLLFGKTPDCILADLALSFAGKELVPLPSFFSDQQLSHIVSSTGLSHVVADSLLAARARKLGLIADELGAIAGMGSEPIPGARRIIFTSGSTGRPKGVRLSARQLISSATALSHATEATNADRYLSLLPNALLLEQVAGIYVPLLVGASIHLPHPTFGLAAGNGLADMIEQTKPTVTVLVPELLTGWLGDLASCGRVTPRSLRYIAVGGAPVAQDLAAAAWQRGLPVHEGYGLSECCSVVSVNRPNERTPGTTGRPIPGVQVSIDCGEIVVSGPTVMDGYLGEPDVSSLWHTGDLGKIDADGRIVVTGRRDNVIVTSTGRNISPEWIEGVIGSDRRIGRCVVTDHHGALVAAVTPVDQSIRACTRELLDALTHAARGAPDYAQPKRWLVLSEREFAEYDLLTPNGRPQRAAVRAFVADNSDALCG